MHAAVIVAPPSFVRPCVQAALAAAAPGQGAVEAPPFEEASIGTVLNVLAVHTTNEGLSQSAAATLSVRGCRCVLLDCVWLVVRQGDGVRANAESFAAA